MSLLIAKEGKSMTRMILDWEEEKAIRNYYRTLQSLIKIDRCLLFSLLPGHFLIAAPTSSITNVPISVSFDLYSIESEY